MYCFKLTHSALQVMVEHVIYFVVSSLKISGVSKKHANAKMSFKV